MTKKVKKSDKKPKDAEPSVVPNVDRATSKKSRKHAADFMGEVEPTPIQSTLPSKPEETKPNKSADNTASNEASAPRAKKPEKSKKSKKVQSEDLLTADGVNGVVEHAGHEELETYTSHKPISSSMQAEAERTVDQEMIDDFGGLSDREADAVAEDFEAEDNTAALLTGFDSDGEDEDEDEGLDASSKLKLSKKKGKEVQKKLSKAQQSGKNEGPGTVYVGRIPHGFYEKEMREYFSQFGDITKLRLSRNKYTGASKHFAFIEFSSTEVAKIVAETMDNYLLFGHILKCKYAQPDSLHPETWKGADKKFRKIPHEKLERERLAAPKTEEQWEKKNEREQKKRNRKGRKLEALGLELPASKLTNPSEALKQQQLEQAEKASLQQIEDAIAGPTGAIKTLNGLPKDEIALKETMESEAGEELEKKKKSKAKKSKKNKATSEAKAESSGDVVEDVATEVAAAEPIAVEPAEDFIPVAVDEDMGTPSKAEAAAISKAKAKAVRQQQRKEEKQAKKDKKNRQNLTKASGPKSALVSTKPAASEQPKVPGLMGKDKYNKAKRQEHKQAKADSL